jgi:ABC-type polysaccharide/polyol phosphate export permease
LVQAVVLGVIFTHIIRFKTATPYPVYVFSGILPWTFFSGGVMLGVTSIVDGSTVASKIYFPRAVLPIETVLAGFYGFVPGVAVLTIFALVMGVHLGPAMLLLVPATLTVTMLSCAFALLLAGLQVYFRDVKHIVAAINLPWFWGSGIIYPLAALGRIRHIVEANPVVGAIQLFRASFGASADHWQRTLWYTYGWMVALIVAAAFVYRRYDRVFTDLL